MAKLHQHWPDRLVETYRRAADDRLVWTGYAASRPAGAVWMDDLKSWLVTDEEAKTTDAAQPCGTSPEIASVQTEARTGQEDDLRPPTRAQSE
jgi:hypothetical protein